MTITRSTEPIQPPSLTRVKLDQLALEFHRRSKRSKFFKLIVTNFNFSLADKLPLMIEQMQKDGASADQI